MVDHGIARPLLDGADLRTAFWPGDAPDGLPCVARADLVLSAPSVVELQILVPGLFTAWVDGEVAAHGPLRWAPEHPEVSTTRLELGRGTHAVAIQAEAGGVAGRITAGLASFVWARVMVDGEDRTPPLIARAMTEYADTGLRISPLLGRIEWLEQPLPRTWRTTPTDRLMPGDGWHRPRSVPAAVAGLGRLARASRELPRWPTLGLTDVVVTGHGLYRETFTGYRWDDPAVQFALADRSPSDADDPDGRWWRLDLGRVRLGSLALEVSTTRPAAVVIAHADRLDPHGEVVPVVALSTGPTRMMHRLAVDAGRSTAESMGALGGRYVEIRIDDPHARLHDVTVVDRDGLGAPSGRFHCGDDRLDAIWRVGLDTLRACAEDVLIDSVRERGGWVGDVVSAGIDLLATGWGDQSLAYRTLVHAAASARPDGLVAGCTPGEPIHLGTYAAQWLSGCLAAADLDPDLPVLTELAEPARACAEALMAGIRSDGTTTLPWGFVDWGHAPAGEAADPAELMHILFGLTAWERWRARLGLGRDDRLDARRHHLRGLIQRLLSQGPLTLHTAALGHRVGLVSADLAAPVIAASYRRAFPFTLTATRLRDPGRVDPGVVTPFFAGPALAVLAEAGRTGELIDLWRGGWGWMLDRGATTWWEVFDDRWSHCHFWSGAPTWQLTRYLLGVRVRFRHDIPVVSFQPRPGPVESCSGRVPLGRRGMLDVEWSRDADGSLVGELHSDLPLALSGPAGSDGARAGTRRIRIPAPDPAATDDGPTAPVAGPCR